MRLVWTSTAAADLEQISDYLLEKRPDLVSSTIERIFTSVSELRQFPRRGRPGRREGTRELVLAQLPYLVVYQIVDQRIKVLRVLHGARRWPE